jgi:hypothetical protein
MSSLVDASSRGDIMTTFQIVLIVAFTLIGSGLAANYTSG